MEEKKEKDLYIPANCPPLNYIVDGFTVKEIAYVGAVIAAAAITAVMIYTVSGNSFLAVFLAGIAICAAILFFRRDMYSENCVDKIRLIMEYYNAPKRHTYGYVNIYEKIREETTRDEKV